MSIFEILSFDFGAFITSTPGIMIIVGIVLLLVGVVLLVHDKKKKTKDLVLDEEEMAKIKVVEDSVKEEVQTPVVVATEGDGVKEVEIAPIPETVNFSETPVVSSFGQMPAVETVVEEKSLVIEELPVASPKVEETLVVESLNTAPAVETLNVSPVLDQPVEQPSVAPVVYGGANPEVTVNLGTVEEKPKEIYGGANPLENTAPIPSNSVKEAYQGSMGVEKPVEVEPTVVTPNMGQVTPEALPSVDETVKVETLTTPTEEVEKLEF